MQQKATKITSYNDNANNLFIVFEDAIYMKKIRLFANHVDNTCPVYFFLDLGVAFTIMVDMFRGIPIERHIEAFGQTKEGKPVARRLKIYDCAYGYNVPKGSYMFNVLNCEGERDEEGRVVGFVDGTGWEVFIPIPKEDARDLAAAVLMRMITGL